MKYLSRFAVAAALLATTVSGCGSSSDQASSETLMVFAAASLKTVFTDLGEQFEAANPGSDIEFSFAGSSDLVTQLTQGAPADVFASADTNNMDKASEAGLVAGDPVNFASNTLTIVAAPGNPNNIASFEDLAQPGLSVVICAPPVPCGSATQKVEDATGVQLDPVSEESQVTDVLNKVTTGQADAGLVYETDARTAGDRVTAIAFPESAEAVNTYPIAVLEQTDNPDLAGQFVEFVRGEVGQKALEEAGFAQP